MNQYDAIVIGAGHNGLTNGAYLAKAGLKVAVLERNPYIGGATVSRELHKGWWYSNCSYVSSLLRPEITRDLELPRHMAYRSCRSVAAQPSCATATISATTVTMIATTASWRVTQSVTPTPMIDMPLILACRPS